MCVGSVPGRETRSSKLRTQDKVEGEGQQPHRVSIGGTERIATDLLYKEQTELRARGRLKEKPGRQCIRNWEQHSGFSKYHCICIFLYSHFPYFSIGSHISFKKDSCHPCCVGSVTYDCSVGHRISDFIRRGCHIHYEVELTAS